MLARRIMHSALTRLREGQLTVLEGDRTIVYGPGGSPATSVVVHDRRVWSAALRGGSIGLGDAYASGWFDTDDLAALMELAARNLEPIWRRRDAWANTVAPLRQVLPRRSRGAAVDRAHIAAHYDLSNEFFSLMLDPTMAYSSAVFDDPGADLRSAQEAKFERLCELLELDEDDHLLEVGTGWGGLAAYAASTRGCRVTTTTISAEQHDFASRRIAELGLGDRVEVLDLDYRDLGGTYDKIVSVEMIEAVDWRDHPAFFETLADRVRPGGRVVLQAIVINDRSYEHAKRHDDFIKARIFPGGCLPSVASIRASAADTGQLAPTAVLPIGHHYPETLRRWQHNVTTHREQVVELGFDDRFLRSWEFYLQYCAGAFAAGHIDVVHVALDKEGVPHGSLPHHDRVLAHT